MAFTAPDTDLLDAPKGFVAPADDEIVKTAFVAPDSDRISVKLDPSQQAYADTGLTDPQNESFDNYSARNPTVSQLFAQKILPAVTTPDQQNLLTKYLQDVQAPELPVSSTARQVWDALNSNTLTEARAQKKQQDAQTEANANQMRQLMQQHGIDQSTIDATVPKPGIVSQVAGGVGNAAADLGTFFTTPMGIGTLGMGALPKVVQRGISLAFAAQMASQTPEIASQLQQEIAKPADQRDWKKISELVTSGLANTAFAGLGAAHGLSSELPASEPPPQSEPANIKDSVAPGTAVPTGAAASTSQNSGFVAPADEIIQQGQNNAALPTTNLPEIGSKLVVRTPDGAVDPVQTALNKMRQPATVESPNGQFGVENALPPHGGRAEENSAAGLQPTIAPTIAARAAETPDKPVTMADFSDLADELKAAMTQNQIKPAENTVLPENDKIPENPELTPALESATKASVAPATDTVRTAANETGGNERQRGQSQTTPSESLGVTAEEGSNPSLGATAISRKQPSRADAQRPPDLIDHIEDQVGTIDPALIKEANPNWKPIGAARKIFKRGGTPADSALNALGTAHGVTPDMPIDEFGDRINAAASARKGQRAQFYKEERSINVEAKQTQKFHKDIGQQSKGTETLVPDDLNEGDQFTLKGAKVKVSKLDFDEDGRVTHLTLDDGKQYGTQEVDGGTALRMDKDSLVKSSDGKTSIGEKANALAAKLESLKSGIKGGAGGQLHAFGLASDLWDRAVSLAQAVIRKGGSIADAITAAIEHIKANHKGTFDEQGARQQLNLATRDVERPDGTPTPERERSAEEVKADVAAAKTALEAATKKSVTSGGKENRQAMYQATAKYRTLLDELLHHADYISEQLAKQHAAVTKANEILKPLDKKVGPEQFPNQDELRVKLSPEQFKRFQDLQQQIEDSHGELSKMPGKMVSRVHGEMQDSGKLPKSDPFMPNAGRTLDQVTDWLRKNGVDSPKKTLAERLNLAEKFTDTVRDAKTSLQKARLKLQSLWTATKESYLSPPVDTDFRHVIKSWIYSDQRTGLATHQFVKELVSKVSNSDRRKGMSVWLDADGDENVLRAQAASVPDAYKKIWDAALKLTPDEKALALKIKSDFAAKLEDGMSVGLLDKGRADYGVPQRWKLKPETDGDFTGDRQKGTPGRINAKLDSRSPFFSFQRETPSYFDGIMSKGVPENLDIAHLVATYDQAFHKSLSSRGMIGALRDAKANDGLPVVKISGSASAEKTSDGTTFFADSRTRNKSDVSVDGRPYEPVNHSALRGWALRMKDESGNPIFVKGDMLVHPDHVAYLKNELENSGLRDVPILGGLMKTQAFLKASKLSASAFHLATIGEHMASHLVNPFTNGFKIDLRQPDQTMLVRNGLELGMGAPQQAYAEGLASGHGGLFNKIPGLGDFSAKMTDWMFKDYIPTIMMKVGLKALESNRTRYGDKLTPDQVAELTARQMNAAGGLLNKRLDGADGNFWGQLGANKTMMDLNRMALMAPQFLEARMKVVGQALKPYGAEQRKMLLLQAGILYAGTRVLNQLLDGDPHWHDNPFSVVHNGRAYSLRTIVGDFYHLITDPASFAAGRLAPITKIAIEDGIMGGRDLRTGARKDVPIETQSGAFRAAQNIVADLAKWLVPITVEGALPGEKGQGQSVASMALTSVGVGSHKFTAVNQIRDLAANFNRNSADAKAKNFQASRDNDSFGHSPYFKLDNLLDAGNKPKAQEEYNALKADGRTAAQIAARYDRTLPFTGNTQREQQFVRSLTPEQKTIYQKARAEQKAHEAAFNALAK